MSRSEKENKKVIQTEVLRKINVQNKDLFLLARVQYQLGSPQFCMTLYDSIFFNKNRQQIENAIQTIVKSCDQIQISNRLDNFISQVPISLEKKLPFLLSKKNQVYFLKNLDRFNFSKRSLDFILDYLVLNEPKQAIEVLKKRNQMPIDRKHWENLFISNEQLLSLHEKLEVINIVLSSDKNNEEALLKSLIYIVRNDPDYLSENWKKYQTFVEKHPFLKEEYFISSLGDQKLNSPLLIDIKNKLLAGHLKNEHKKFSKKTQRKLNRYSSMLKELKKEIGYLQACNCLKNVTNKKWLTLKYYKIKRIKHKIDHHAYLHKGLAKNIQKQFNIVIKEYLALFHNYGNNRNLLLSNFELVFKKWRYQP